MLSGLGLVEFSTPGAFDHEQGTAFLAKYMQALSACFPRETDS